LVFVVFAGSDLKVNPASLADHEMNPFVCRPWKWKFAPSLMVSGEPSPDHLTL
jgi:hypothetical protein